MDKDKAIEAAEALMNAINDKSFAAGKFIISSSRKDSTNISYIMDQFVEHIKESSEYKALKEALENKPSREDCIEWLIDGNQDNYTFEEGHKLADATIEYLKQPTDQ